MGESKLEDAPEIEIEVRICFNMLDPKAPSATWLDILIAKKHWAIIPHDKVLKGLEPNLIRIAAETQKRISQYLDDNKWAAPFDVVVWMRTWLRGSIYIGKVKPI